MVSGVVLEARRQIFRGERVLESVCLCLCLCLCRPCESQKWCQDWFLRQEGKFSCEKEP